LISAASPPITITGLLDLGQERRRHHEGGGLGVLGDVDDLGAGEERRGRHHDRADLDRGEVRHQGRRDRGGAEEDAVLLRDPERSERASQLIDGGLELPVGELLLFVEDGDPVPPPRLDVAVHQLLGRVEALGVRAVLRQRVDALRPQLLRGEVGRRDLAHAGLLSIRPARST
jgi:hypothetical protein